jgi:uncharacterized damage-inducible protein DinB
VSVESLFLNFSVDKLRLFETRIEVCLGKLSDEQVWVRGGENENAVGNLVLHLMGNVRQWIIAGLGGVPDIRNRDGEFDARSGPSAAELATALRSTIAEATEVISGLSTEELTRVRAIQIYNVSGLEAVYQAVEHFAQHTGQIIFATKLLTGSDLGFYRHLSKGARSQNNG